MNVSVAIVGAGIAGLTAATRLRQRGVDTIVLDKGRGPGGRSSTRRHGPNRFDHGAQYFTCRHPEFRSQLQEWVSAGVVAPWSGRIAAVDSPGCAPQPVSSELIRYVGVPGMNAMARHMAANVRCEFGVEVTGLGRDGQWTLHLASGRSVRTDCLVLTVPPQQADALLPNLHAVSQLPRLEMNPCWALMFVTSKPMDPGFDGAFVNGGPLSWMAHDSTKPGRQTNNCWVAHAAPDWSLEHLDHDPDWVRSALLAAVADVVDLPPIEYATVHRWRYAQAAEPLTARALTKLETGLIVAGDWCAGSKIEGAFLAGCAAADAVAHVVATRA